ATSLLLLPSTNSWTISHGLLVRRELPSSGTSLLYSYPGILSEPVVQPLESRKSCCGAARRRQGRDHAQHRISRCSRERLPQASVGPADPSRTWLVPTPWFAQRFSQSDGPLPGHSGRAC